MVYKNKKSVNLQAWEQVNTEKGKLLYSNLLNHYGFSHGFFSKHSQMHGPKHLAKYIGKDCSIHFIKQVHGNSVVNASEVTDDNNLLADSIISNKSGQSLWIYSADCIPILFADKSKGTVAATHSGWKGLNKNIIKETVNFLKLTGSDVEDLIVALGPAISINHYQVSLDLLKGLIRSYSLQKQEEEEGLIQSFYKTGALKDDIKPNKFKLDIRLIAKHKLEMEGISSENVSTNSNCTYSELDHFNSWRRDGIKSCQWSAILSK